MVSTSFTKGLCMLLLAISGTSVEAKARNTAKSCSSTLKKITDSIPTPTDKDLSSWMYSHATSEPIPESLRSAYCTFERKEASWVSATGTPFATSCKAYINSAFSSSLSVYNRAHATTQSWCSTVATRNAAPSADMTHVGAGIIAVAGIVVAAL